MDPADARSNNRVAVLNEALRQSGVTRTAIAEQTGLSAATVSRVVEELMAEGFLDEGKQLHRRGRGRRSTYIELGSEAGCVVGVDCGVATTRLQCADLRGTPLGSRRRDTPQKPDPRELAEWVATQVTDLLAETNTSHPLRMVVVAVPASVRAGADIVRPAADLSKLAGREFYDCLADNLRVPLMLDTDSNTALEAEMHDGLAAGAQDVVLFTLSTGLSAGVAINGSVLRRHAGRLGQLGEFGFMPMGSSNRSLEACLTVHGILIAAEAAGTPIADVAELLQPSPPSPIKALRDLFIDGVVLVVSAVALTADPEVIVFTGRMRPVVEQVLPDVRTRLSQTLPMVPQLRVTSAAGFSAASGAALIAVRQARQVLLERAGAGRERAGTAAADGA